MTVKEFYDLAKEKNMENAIMLAYDCGCWHEVCEDVVSFIERTNKVEIT